MFLWGCWCKGNMTDCGSVDMGSIPILPPKIKNEKIFEKYFVFIFKVCIFAM